MGGAPVVEDGDDGARHPFGLQGGGPLPHQHLHLGGRERAVVEVVKAMPRGGGVGDPIPSFRR